MHSSLNDELLDYLHLLTNIKKLFREQHRICPNTDLRKYFLGFRYPGKRLLNYRLVTHLISTSNTKSLSRTTTWFDSYQLWTRVCSPHLVKNILPYDFCHVGRCNAPLCSLWISLFTSEFTHLFTYCLCFLFSELISLIFAHFSVSFVSVCVCMFAWYHLWKL